MIENLMVHSVDLWNPVFAQGSTQEIRTYTRLQRGIPAFIQPATSDIEIYYMQRGMTNIHNVFTSDVDTVFEKEQILKWQGRQFHVIGVVNALFLRVYQNLTVEEYIGAKKRLDIEDYD